MKFKKITALLLALSLLLCGCANNSLKKNDSIIAKLKNVSGVNGDTLVLEFDKQKVNTVIIEDNGDEENPYTVSILTNDKEYLYQQTQSGRTKYCAFNTFETDRLNIKIDGADYDIKSIKAYYDKDKADDNFRVTTYAVADRILDKKSLDKGSFDVITDVILFGCVSFDENGRLFFNDYEKQSGEAVMTKAMANLRSVIGNRNVNIYINILGPNPDNGIEDSQDRLADKAKKHTKAFKTGKLEMQIRDFVDKYDFDGVFFDYEYPLKSKDWKSFNKFLVSLNASMGEKKIGLALSDRNLEISKDAINSIDMAEIMAYDSFDQYGNHSSFAAAQSAVDKFLDKGFEPKKLDLGVPFYGRPADAGEYWYNYYDYADVLGKNENKAFIAEQGKDAYFNSWQLIYDKTALAMDYGLGGMMVWHYSCDSFEKGTYSLFGAMSECINDRG